MKIKLDKNTQKIICKTKDEWLSKRVIGGTTLSAILNKSKWSSPNDVYNELVLGKRKNVSSNERIETGHKNENVIAQLFANDFQKEYEVINAPKGKYWIFVRKDKQYITCTPDRLLINKQNGDLEGLEIKDIEIITNEQKNAWLTDLLPDEYFYQCIHYFITFPNMKKVILFPNLKFYTFRNNNRIYDYSMHKRYILYREECEEIIKYCEKKIDEFYQENIVKKIRPKRTIKL